jgi:hypothetical protein
MRSSTPILLTLAALGLVVAGCSNRQAQVQAALAGVCSGRGVPDAAAYAGGGVHPVVVLTSSGEPHDWSDDLAETWYPQSVQAAQLVACVEEEQERSIEVCPYNGPDITRYRYEVAIRLVEARTGVEVASTVLRGNDPRECRQTEDYDLTRLAGDHISYSAAADWLRAHVEMASVSASTAPEPAEPASSVQNPPGASSPQASFVGEWQATDSYDGSAMRLTITGDAVGGYLLVWDDEYWSLCEGSAIVETTGSMDASDPNSLHSYWVVECAVPGQVGEFAADIRYSELNDTLELIYDDGTSDTWYRASSPSSPQASFVGEWQATDSYDGSAMRLTIAGDTAGGYLLMWDDEYWSLCEGSAIVGTTGSMDASDPNILHTYWVVECAVPGQVGEFAADIRYSELNDTLELIYDDGASDTWYRASSPSSP